MKKTKSANRPDDSTLTTVERWAVERLDRDAGMARIEAVPMRPEKATPAMLDSLAGSGPLEGMDDLSMWDGRKAKLKSMTLQHLVKRLGLRKDEEEKLSENMVFWVIRGEKTKEEQVYHATSAARKISKDLYRKVTRTEGDEK